MNGLILYYFIFIEKDWTRESHIDMDKADEAEDKWHEINLRLSKKKALLLYLGWSIVARAIKWSHTFFVNQNYICVKL